MTKELTTLFTGRNRISLITVDSTNTYLSEILKNEPLPEGSVVQAMFQSEGRGEANSRWVSDAARNLLLSFIFYPDFLNVDNLFLLSKTFSLAIHDYVKSHLGPGVRIKWPNDIFWVNYKICGMLIENGIKGHQIGHSILGVGVNINQENFPAMIPNPISIGTLLKKELDLEVEFRTLCSHLEARYLQLRKGDYTGLIKDYDLALFRKDEWHLYEKSGKLFLGKITGVNEQGLLCLENESGMQESFNLKEVKFI